MHQNVLWKSTLQFDASIRCTISFWMQFQGKLTLWNAINKIHQFHINRAEFIVLFLVTWLSVRIPPHCECILAHQNYSCDYLESYLVDIWKLNITAHPSNRIYHVHPKINSQRLLHLFVCIFTWYLYLSRWNIYFY